MPRWKAGILAAGVLLLVGISSRTAWSSSGVLISAGPEQSYPCNLISDGSQGAYVTWLQVTDFSHPGALYVTRLTPGGGRAWSSDVLVASDVTEILPTITRDGTGGAILAWRGLGGFAYVQRVDRSGVLAWAAPVPLGGPVGYVGRPPLAIPDGSGGAIFAWSEDRAWDDIDRVYVQRVDHNGVASWGDGGKLVNNGPGRQTVGDNGTLLPDGNGGAILAYYDQVGTITNLRVQHVDAAGTFLWPGSGPLLSAAGNPEQLGALVPMTGGGVAMVWSEARNADLLHVDFDIYAAALNANGTLRWGPTAVCNANYNQRASVAAPDGMGGLFLAWDDFRPLGGFALPHIFAQHLDGGGHPTWASNGLHLGGAGSGGFESEAAILQDGRGGFWLTWAESDVLEPDMIDIRAGQFMGSGVPAIGTPAGGVVICDAAGNQTDPAITSIGRSQVLIDWKDERRGSMDVYAWICPVSMMNAGPKSSAAGPGSMVRATALASGRMQVQFVPAGAGRVDITVTDVQGRAVAHQSVNAAAGVNSVSLEGVRLAGVYFVTIAQGGSIATSKAVVLH